MPRFTRLLFLLIIGALPLVGEATPNLDIFKTEQFFDSKLIPKTDSIKHLNLQNPEQISQTIKTYLTVIGAKNNRIQNNLLYLTVGYLYLKQHKFSKAYEILNKNIYGNFILEDYKLYFQAEALKEKGNQYLQNHKYNAAVKAINNSIQLLLRIYRSFPESPLYYNLNRDLALTERILGDAFLQTMNYKKAWQTYRRSLMRNFPGNEEHRLEVSLALARTYQSVGDLKEATDIYTHLLSWKADDSRVQVAIKIFLHKFEKPLIESGVSTKILMGWKSRNDSDGDINEKIKKYIQEEADVDDPLYQEYFISLKQNDFPGMVRRAWTVMKAYPGTVSTGKVVETVNRKILEYLSINPWEPILDPLVGLYSADILSDLAINLWRSRHPKTAAKFYLKIIEKYPHEIAMSHKALYFLGRIFEDEGEYEQALTYYRRLLKEYNFGSYYLPAFFKIPWILRLQGKLKEAVKIFEDIIEYYVSENFTHFNPSFDQAQSFYIAAHYWLAQTHLSLGSIAEANHYRQKLVHEFPFNFYAIISRGEMGMNLSELVEDKAVRIIAPRVMGLGDIQRKHLSRAEKLISVGLTNFGILELNRVKIKESADLGFIFYLAKLYHHAGEFQKSLRFSWKIVEKSQLSQLSRDLRDTLFPKPYLKLVESVLGNRPIDSYIFLALMRQESAFNPVIVSSANAIGLMQLLPSTAKQIAHSKNLEIPDKEKLKNPIVNINLGIDYFEGLLKIFDQNVVYALASYNAGPNKVAKWLTLRRHLNIMEFIESIPYNETREYVKKVLRNFYLYSAFYRNQSFSRVEDLLKQ